MSLPLKIVVAQLNPIVGDLQGNVDALLAAYQNGVEQGADMVVAPELSVTGYPPEDLLFKTHFIDDVTQATQQLIAKTVPGTALLFGVPMRENEQLFNAAIVAENGNILHKQYKHHLPNYGVFDEKRRFVSGNIPQPFTYKNTPIGLLICEDMWHDTVPKAFTAVDMLVSINASPFTQEKQQQREAHAAKAAQTANAPLLYVNQVGGQDELVFDGSSFAMNAKGDIVFKAPILESYVGDVSGIATNLNKDELLYKACVLGLKDYVRKNGFSHVVMGLSGGIDSALTAAMAVDALGAKQVELHMLPSRHTSKESKQDAKDCAEFLGCDYSEISIEPMFEAYLTQMKLEGVARENIQSRIRGAILMARSNSTGAMLLTTGNKSEMAVGYATLYGDMCGGFNPLKDLYKMQVYGLSEYRGIPKNIIKKPPTAELKDNQTDQDSLPPYPVLDAILEQLIEQDASVKATAAILDQDEKLVGRIARLLYLAEYKRRQAPPGVKTTSRNFGRDRRYPITNKYRK